MYSDFWNKEMRTSVKNQMELHINVEVFQVEVIKNEGISIWKKEG